MISPLRCLFRIGGLFPKNTRFDKYFTCSTILIQLFSMYISTINAFSNPTMFLVYFDVLENIVFCLNGIWFVLKAHVSKSNTINLVNLCLTGNEGRFVPSPHVELLIFLLFISVFAARFVVRYVNSQTFLLSLLYDVAMATIYSPCLMIMLMVHQLNGKFSVLNDQLTELTVAVRSRASSLDSLRTDLEAVFRKHILLRDLKAEVNSNVGLFLAICVSCHAAYGTYSMYLEFLNILNKGSYFNSLNIMVLTSGVSSIVFTCDACYSCAKQVIKYVLEHC